MTEKQGPNLTSMLEQVDMNIGHAKMAGGVAGATWYALTLNEWVAACTIMYLGLQIGLLMPKYAEIVKPYLMRMGAWATIKFRK